MPRVAPAGVNLSELEGPVVHGQEDQKLTKFFEIHERWNHGPHGTLKYLPHCLSDWGDRAFPADSRCGCDPCLKGSADALPSFAQTA